MSNNHLTLPDQHGGDQKPDRPLSFSMFTWYTDTLPEFDEPPKVRRPNSSPVTGSPPGYDSMDRPQWPKQPEQATHSKDSPQWPKQPEQATHSKDSPQRPKQAEQVTEAVPEVTVRQEEEAPPTQVIMRHESQYRDEAYDYLCFSMFNMLLCCFPLGIIAIQMSLDVRARNAGEDYKGAHKMSKNARKWNHAALIAGIIQYIVSILTVVLFFTVGQKGSRTVKYGTGGVLLGAGWEEGDDSWN